MFRSHHFVVSSFVVTALGSTAVAANLEARHEEQGVTVTASAPGRSGDISEITDLRPFTHVASIPAGVNLSSIKLERVKMVKVATKRRTTTNRRYCDLPWSEPGGSMYCSQTTDESPVPAYEVTYSYQGEPMASDEYGSRRFVFTVYFHPDEVGPALRRAISSGKRGRTAAAESFQLTTSRDSIDRFIIDEANSTTCDGNYMDGNWVRANPECQDRVVYKKVPGTSQYITVNVDPNSSSPVVVAVAGIRPSQQ